MYLPDIFYDKRGDCSRGNRALWGRHNYKHFSLNYLFKNFYSTVVTVIKKKLTLPLLFEVD